MDKPKIVAIRRPEEESEVPPERQPENGQADAQPTEVVEQPAQPAAAVVGQTEPVAEQPAQQAETPAGQAPKEGKPERPEKKQAGADGLTDLERSVLDEMRKRGEISPDEETAIAREAKARNAPMPTPPAPPRQRQVGQVEAEAIPGSKSAGQEVEVASEEEKPRVIAGTPPWVRTQAKPIIKQTRVNGIVVKEEGEASTQRQPDDHLAQPESREYTPEERQAAADLARKIYERKQREKSLFYRIRKMLGMVKEEPLVASK